MTELKNDVNGQVRIADDVIALIAATASEENEGVLKIPNNIADGISEIFGKKSVSKGVRVSVNEGQVALEINIIIKFGYKIHDVAADVQARIKSAVETMTGLSVVSVNVNICDVVPERKKDAPNQPNQPK